VIEDYVESNSHTILVCVFRHEVAEYLMIVKELPIQSLLTLLRRLRIRILYPNIPLVVLLNKYTLHSTVHLHLLLNLLL